MSCVIWDRKNEIKKAELSMLEISSAIIGKVDSKPDSMDYFYVGIFFSTTLAFLPVICRLINVSADLTLADAHHFFEEMYTNITLIESQINTNCTVLTFYKAVLGDVLGEFRRNIFSSLNGNVW